VHTRDVGADGMRSRRWIKPGTFVLALAASAFLAILGVDVMRWDRQLEQADLRFASGTGRLGMWTADTYLPTDLSGSLLGVEEDVAVRRAVQSFRRSRPRRPAQQFTDVARRSAAEAELARAVRMGPGRRQEARLMNLRGVLRLEEARGAPSETSVLLRRAAASFREAIRNDLRYEDAKFNLELTLRLLQRGGSPSGGGGGDRADTPASGAGTASTGRGY
jgi:hypothetical protein